MSNTQVVSNFPTLAILGLIFVTLKLTSVITWSWWWILLPFYGPILATMVLLFVVAVVVFVTRKPRY